MFLKKLPLIALLACSSAFAEVSNEKFYDLSNRFHANTFDAAEITAPVAMRGPCYQERRRYADYATVLLNLREGSITYNSRQNFFGKGNYDHYTIQDFIDDFNGKNAARVKGVMKKNYMEWNMGTIQEFSSIPILYAMVSEGEDKFVLGIRFGLSPMTFCELSVVAR